MVKKYIEWETGRPIDLIKLSDTLKLIEPFSEKASPKTLRDNWRKWLSENTEKVSGKHNEIIETGSWIDRRSGSVDAMMFKYGYMFALKELSKIREEIIGDEKLSENEQVSEEMMPEMEEVINDIENPEKKDEIK